MKQILSHPLAYNFLQNLLSKKKLRGLWIEKYVKPNKKDHILDLGCGPGRDLQYFNSMGHAVMGLDGSEALVSIARLNSGCEVLQQNFLAMDLPEHRFDGVFANASLFHVPSKELPRILLEVSTTLKSRGVLFCSNPRETTRKVWMEVDIVASSISTLGVTMLSMLGLLKCSITFAQLGYRATGSRGLRPFGEKARPGFPRSPIF